MAMASHILQHVNKSTGPLSVFLCRENYFNAHLNATITEGNPKAGWSWTLLKRIILCDNHEIQRGGDRIKHTMRC